MNQFPNNFNFDKGDADFSHLPNIADKQLSEIENLSAENLARLSLHKKQLKRLIIYLAGFGFGLGLILAIVLIITLNKLGLTKKPYQLPAKPDRQIEQIKLHHSEALPNPIADWQ